MCPLKPAMTLVPPLFDPTSSPNTQTSTNVTASASATKARLPRPGLSEALRLAAREVYVFVAMNDLTDLSIGEWEEGFANDLNPQDEIFWWQQWAMANVVAAQQPDGSKLDRPHVRLLRDRDVVQRYSRVELGTRRRQAKHLFSVMNGVEDVEEHRSDPGLQVRCDRALDAVRRATRAPDHLFRCALDIRLAEVCAACARCVRSPKLCSRCLRPVYCGRECQLMHWPRHMFECRKRGEVDRKAGFRDLVA